MGLPSGQALSFWSNYLSQPMSKALYSIALLFVSNVFMTMAWYGHLALKERGYLQGRGLFVVIIVSWGFAFFEYLFMIPANTIGSKDTGGPFTLFQLKTIQEVVSLTVFTLVVTFIFKSERPGLQHLVGFLLLLAAVYVVFKKW